MSVALIKYQNLTMELFFDTTIQYQSQMWILYKVQVVEIGKKQITGGIVKKETFGDNKLSVNTQLKCAY